MQRLLKHAGLISRAYPVKWRMQLVVMHDGVTEQRLTGQQH
jgi:hypothetical protein